MNSPLSTKVNFEDKWYGYESMGRFSGEPAIFLYYGDEGVDKNYTVDSVVKELKGWNWTWRISSHDSHVVFASIPDSEVDPLQSKYESEILNLLKIQDHRKARAITSGEIVPSEEVDDVVDHYTIVKGAEGFRKKVEERDEKFDWFANESHYRDRTDFVFGFDGLRKNIQYIEDLNREYPLSKNKVWLYQEAGSFKDLMKTAKQTGCRVCLPPNYYKRKEEESEES